VGCGGAGEAHGVKETAPQSQSTDRHKGAGHIAKQLDELYLTGNKLTGVKGLEALTQLEALDLRESYNLTKAQIAELQKALPKYTIFHSATK
jgi:hypothetical protein